MFNRNWFDSIGDNWGNNQGNWGNNQGNWDNQGWGNNAQQLPTRTSPTQYEQAQVSPTRQYVQRHVSNTVVPQVHPSHLTNINQHYIHNQHYFPHTQSEINECFVTNTMCETPFSPQQQACPRRRRWR